MSQPPTYHFRLYVAGDAPNSVLAVANLHTLCREHFEGQHRIEIVDVTREPKRALSDNVLLTPTLLRLAPGPERKILGNLSDSSAVLQVFDTIPRK